MARDTEKYRDGDEHGDEGRATITDEREGNARKWNDIEVYADVYESLDEYHRRDSRGHEFGKRIVHRVRNEKSSVTNKQVARNQDEYTDKT